MPKSIHVQLTLPKGLEAKYVTFVTNEDHTQMCWLGGFGTAKTDALVTSILETAINYPGCVMALCRDELTNLKRTSLADLLAKAPELIVDHNRTESVITFPAVPGHDGVLRSSTLYCFGLMTGDYKQKLKSLQPFRIFIDEGDKIHEEMFDMCVLRIRQKAYHRVTGKLGKNQVKIVANDEGNNWLWRRFVGKPHPGKKMDKAWVEDNIGLKEDFFDPQNIDDIFENDIVTYQGERRLVTRVLEDENAVHLSGLNETVPINKTRVVLQKLCLYAFSAENKSLNVQNLAASREVSQALREQYFLGQVDTQTGLVFPEFDGNLHIIPDGDVPSDWRVVVGLDHGYDHPTAGSFIAVDPMGDLIIFDEYERAGWSASENAYSLLEKVSGFDRVRWYGDSQMWAVDPRRPSESVAKDYTDAGVRPLARANKAREMGINRIKEFLRPRQGLLDPEPRARLYVMSSCRRTIERLSNIQWEEFDKKVNDDLIDALRYAVVSVYTPSATSGLQVGGRAFSLQR